jgi:hypothetical protein
MTVEEGFLVIGDVPHVPPIGQNGMAAKKDLLHRGNKCSAGNHLAGLGLMLGLCLLDIECTFMQ